MPIKYWSNNNLILTQNEIKFIEQNFNSAEDISPDIISILNKSIPVKNYYIQQHQNRNGLQGGKILELVIAATLAQSMGLCYNINNNTFENKDYLLIITAEEGKGTGAVHDINILDKNTNITYTAEIKDEIARAGDCDIRYDENGHLHKSPRSRSWNEEWQPILDIFNETTNVFNLAGHNYPISEHKEICESIVKKYFQGIDLLFTVKNNKLIIIDLKNSDNLSSLFSFKGSEIRPLSGKNPVNVFTPNYLDKIIKNSVYFISATENEYTMKSAILKEVIGRGGGISRYYNFLPGFKVLKEKISFIDDTCTFTKDAIKQLNSNISVHLSLNTKNI